MHYPDLHPSLAQWIADINDRLVSLLVGESATLRDAGGVVIGSRGKRLRPVMLLMSCASLGEVTDRVVTHGALVEMIHAASLAHDDVVDEADTRRGAPSAPARWGNKFSILLGDYLLARVFDQAVCDGDVEILRLLAGASTDMARAVVQECADELDLDGGEEAYWQVIHGKTSALFAASAAIGGRLGGATPVQQQALFDLGLSFGFAFQVADDLLNLQASEEDTGKPPGSDWAQHRVTLPLLYAVQAAPIAVADEIRALWAQEPCTDEHFRSLAYLVETTGGFDYGWRKVNAYREAACRALDVLPAGQGREALRLLCTDLFPLPILPAAV